MPVSFNLGIPVSTLTPLSTANVTPIKADTADTTIPQSLASLNNAPDLAGYEDQLRTQGEAAQRMVITKGDDVAGTIGEDGGMMFQEGDLLSLWQEANGDENAFTTLLAQNGYGIKTFSPGEGPTYGQVHEAIHKESYETLIARQTREYYREMAASDPYRPVFSVKG